MSVVGFNTVMRKSGTATTMSSQAMSTNSTVADTYQVSSSARRVFNRDAAFIFYEDDGTTAGGRQVIPSSDVDIDYLFGKVLFGSIVAPPITVTGQYLPMTVLAGAHSYSMNAVRELLDDTDFESAGYRSHITGMKDVTLTVSRFAVVDKTFFDLIDSGNAVLVDVMPGGSGDAGRGFFLISSDNWSGDVNSLEAADLTFELDSSTKTDFQWGTP